MYYIGQLCKEELDALPAEAFKEVKLKDGTVRHYLSVAFADKHNPDERGSHYLKCKINGQSRYLGNFIEYKKGTQK